MKIADIAYAVLTTAVAFFAALLAVGYFLAALQ